MLIPGHLTTSQIEQVRDAFNIFDKDKDGTITREELKSVMLALGLNPSETEIMDMIDSADTDKNGVIDINEFISLMPSLTGDKSFAAPSSGPASAAEKNSSTSSGSKDLTEEEELRKAFKEFDTNGDGVISPEELNQVMQSIGEKLTADEIQVIIQEVDNNGDGRIDYNEFCKIYSGR